MFGGMFIELHKHDRELRDRDVLVVAGQLAETLGEDYYFFERSSEKLLRRGP